MSEERIAKRMRFTGRIVALEVVEVDTTKPTTVSVHEPIIMADSDFFKLALNKKWKEGQNFLVELPEDSVNIVAAYVEWLYTEKVTTDKWEELVRAYVFAEKIQSSRYCNAIMSKMIAIHNTRWSIPIVREVNILFDGTPLNSPARQFMVDIYQTNGVDLLLSSPVNGVQPHPELVMGLAIAAIRKGAKDFHTHMDKDEAWFKKM